MKWLVHSQQRFTITVNQRGEHQPFPMTPCSMTHKTRRGLPFLSWGPTNTLNGGTWSTPDGFSPPARSDYITHCLSSLQGIIPLMLLLKKREWCVYMHLRQKWSCFYWVFIWHPNSQQKRYGYHKLLKCVLKDVLSPVIIYAFCQTRSLHITTFCYQWRV